MVNINKYNTHTQKLIVILNKFKIIKGRGPEAKNIWNLLIWRMDGVAEAEKSEKEDIRVLLPLSLTPPPQQYPTYFLSI